MTFDQALDLRAGDYVTHRTSEVPGEPLRVTAIWINATRTIIRIRIAKVNPSAWADPTEYELPPVDMLWDKGLSRWLTKDEFRARHSPDLRRWARPTPIEEPSDA